MKVGYKTTEFWMTVIAVLVKYFFPEDFPAEAFYAVAAYAVSRAMTKWGA